MTNKEYIFEEIKDRLKYLIEYAEGCKSGKLNFKETNFICDIAASIYFGECDKCPLDGFCTNWKGEDSCYSNWWRYLRNDGGKEEYEQRNQSTL